jgi:hypothetical protein
MAWGPKRCGYLDGSARLAAFRERDGIGATLVRETLARRIANADAADELHEPESELIGDEPVMWERIE